MEEDRVIHWKKIYTMMSKDYCQRTFAMIRVMSTTPEREEKLEALRRILKIHI